MGFSVLAPTLSFPMYNNPTHLQTTINAFRAPSVLFDVISAFLTHIFSTPVPMTTNCMDRLRDAYTLDELHAIIDSFQMVGDSQVSEELIRDFRWGS
jgi:hypothetical protein